MSRRTFAIVAVPACVGAALFALMAVSGCSGAEPGTSRLLGKVSYGSAYATSREVLSQHFSVLPSDPSDGVLVCRATAEPGAAKSARLIGLTTSGRRRRAKLRLVREGELIVAHMAVTIEQQENPVYRNAPQPDQEYSSVPNLTPAQEDAATTPEQNDVWQVVGRDRILERRILADIHRALSPAGGKPPAKPPAKPPPKKPAGV